MSTDLGLVLFLFHLEVQLFSQFKKISPSSVSLPSKLTFFTTQVTNIPIYLGYPVFSSESFMY